MTRPLGEPTVAKELGSQRRGIERLARRPAPIVTPGDPAVEFISLTSSTDTGTSLTILDWTVAGGNYDDVTPTFEVNANSNPQIFKQGFYSFSVAIRAAVNNANVNTTRQIEADVISGETPNGMFEPWTTSRLAEVITRLNHVDTGAENTEQFPWPVFTDYMSFQQDTFGGGTAGPSELQIRALKREDNVGVAETQWTFHMIMIRHGGSYS